MDLNPAFRQAQGIQRGQRQWVAGCRLFRGSNSAISVPLAGFCCPPAPLALRILLSLSALSSHHVSPPHSHLCLPRNSCAENRGGWREGGRAELFIELERLHPSALFGVQTKHNKQIGPSTAALSLNLVLPTSSLSSQLVLRTQLPPHPSHWAGLEEALPVKSNSEPGPPLLRR